MHSHGRSQRLRESAEQFRLAQETLGIVTWIWDVPTDRVQWHGDGARLLGLPQRAFSGRYQDYLKRLHPDDAATARSVLVDCLKGRRPEYRNVERVVWTDGSIHWLETYGRATYGDDGRAVRMTGVIKEITERMQQESRMRQSESKFAALFEHSPEAISLYRVADGVRLEANAAWERLSGYPRQRVAGRPVNEASLFRSADHRAAIIARIEAEGTVSNIDARLVRADGSEMDALISAVRIELEGAPCILWSWRDVTIEREIARRARQSDARYRALFETSLDGMVIGTPQNTVIDANPAACAMTGYTRSELAGKDVSLLFHPEDLTNQPLRRDLGQRWSVVERRLAPKGGGELRVEIVAGPMPDGSVLAMMRDITKLRRSE